MKSLGGRNMYKHMYIYNVYILYIKSLADIYDQK